MTRLLLSLLAIASIAHADFDPARWHFRRPIATMNPAPVVSFTVDSTVYRGSSARLSDLRIVRDGVETPYVVRELSGAAGERELRGTLLDKAIVPGNGLQATIDLRMHATHNRLRVETRQTNFKQRVRIETSDNAKSWASVRDDGYIFDFSQGDRNLSLLSVDYPVSTRRYIRLTIYGWTNSDWLDAAWLTHYTSTNGVVDWAVSFTPSPQNDSQTQSTLLSADIGFEGLPHDRVQLAVDPGYFYRTVEVETSSDGKSWIFAGQGTISRTADDEVSTVSFSEQWDRYLRVKIFNHDNAPLHVQKIALGAFQRRVDFPATSAGHYAVYYGNAEAKQPVYDFADTVTLESKQAPVSLGAEEANPGYKPPPPPVVPWSDRHPAILYSVLVAAILGMGAFAVRFLVKLRASN